MNAISLIVLSCDNYSQYWDWFFACKNKYWSDCPYPTYLVTQSKRCQHCKTINIDTEIWTKRTREALEQIDSDYVLLMLDDYFIREPVDQKRINKIVLDDDTIVYNFEQNYRVATKVKTGWAIQCNNQVYLNSTQPSLWDRKKLIERLATDQNPWKWELTTVDSPYKHYINTKHPIINTGYIHGKEFGVKQGRLTQECKDFLVREKLLKIKLSIIVPYYNTLQLTQRLFERLLPQMTHETELILVDDGCHEKALDKYPIKVIHTPNGGVSKARNTGLSVANGEFITFVDSDDMVFVDYIPSILDAINTKEFDYCLFGWQSIRGDVEVRGDPPAWNTSVWNCIYKRTEIGGTRFDVKKQISEDTEFNVLVRKGKKAYIDRILYQYNNQREDSLTKLYQKGVIKVQTESKITAQIIIYRSYLSLLGGIESAIYNLCHKFKDKYDITFLYDTADDLQLIRLKKLVNCIKFEGQNVECDTFIFYGFSPYKILDNVVAKEYIQQICCDVQAVRVNLTIHPKITKIFADSEASAKSFMGLHPNLKCETLHNVFLKHKPKRVLHLMTASRLSWEKGYDRMKVMAKRMHQLGVPFCWEVFTNDKPNEEIDGMIFRKPRLSVQEYMHNKDYGVQLSETESWCCTASEFLSAGVPMVLTNFPSATEQIEDGINGYIVKRDLSNLDSVIERMYSTKLKILAFRIKSGEEWTRILGDERVSDYKYEKHGECIVKAIRNYYDIVAEKHVVHGQVYEVTKSRARVLEGDNDQHLKFAEVLD